MKSSCNASELMQTDCSDSNRKSTLKSHFRTQTECSTLLDSETNSKPTNLALKKLKVKTGAHLKTQGSELEFIEKKERSQRDRPYGHKIVKSELNEAAISNPRCGAKLLQMLNSERTLRFPTKSKVKGPSKKQNQKSNNHFFSKSKAERSIFGDMNIHRLKFKRTSTQPAELTVQHPLKHYMKSNAEGNSKLLRAKRSFKTANPILSNGDGFENREGEEQLLSSKQKRSEQREQSNQQKAKEEAVDEIFNRYNKFREVGYSDRKINEWVRKYCQYRRKYMVRLLMKPINKRVFTDEVDYFFEREPQAVKQKLRSSHKRINGVQQLIDHFDLQEFSQYLEEILVQKNKIKVDELRSSILEKLDECFIYNRELNMQYFGKQTHTADMLNFVSDLKQVELQNGTFRSVSTFNREYFSDLGLTEKAIRRRIYDLISIADYKQGEGLRTLRRNNKHQEGPKREIDQSPKSFEERPAISTDFQFCSNLNLQAQK